MGLPTVTIEGRVGGDPELRFIPSGAAVCNFSIAVQDRKKNEQTGQWEDDGPTNWYRVTVWREQAENVAESVVKGDLVVIQGRLSQREYDAPDGTKRQSIDLTADWVALSLRFNSARANRTQRQQQGQQPQGQQPTWGQGYGAQPQGQQPQGGYPPQGQQPQGWQGQPQGQQQDPWGTPPGSNPPF